MDYSWGAYCAGVPLVVGDRVQRPQGGWIQVLVITPRHRDGRLLWEIWFASIA